MKNNKLAILAMAAGFGAYATIDRAPGMALACIGIIGVIILIDRIIDMYETRAARRFRAEVEREVRRRLEAEHGADRNTSNIRHR